MVRQLVISLKKILQDDDGAGEETLVRVVRLLLQSIERHAIEGDPDDLGTFRIVIQRLTNLLEGGLTASELLVQAGSAAQTLEDYNRRTARYLKRPAGEWQAVVTMLGPRPWPACRESAKRRPSVCGKSRDGCARRTEWMKSTK